MNINEEFDEKISSVNNDIFWTFVRTWEDEAELTRTMKNWNEDDKKDGLQKLQQLEIKFETENNPLTKTYNALTNYYNSTNPARKLKELLSYWLNNEHRYLQEEVIRNFIFPLIKECALRSSENRYVDERNEYSYNLCKKLVENNKEFFENI
jgi:hypothetical protein